MLALAGTPAKGDIRYTPDWRHMLPESRTRRAHAELIVGMWGEDVEDVEDLTVCDHCAGSTITDAIGPCRVYRADLRAAYPRKLGFQCARCRLSGRDCSIVDQRKAPVTTPSRKAQGLSRYTPGSRAGKGGRPRSTPEEKVAAHERNKRKAREAHARRQAAKKQRTE
ncbi:hypothetical protein PMIN07_012481 [Paraphaeosphaeria minitans]